MVLIISVVALIIASNPNSGTIMSLVSNAWGVFGAAFGPAIMLSLFWKRFTFAGAVVSIIVGAAVTACGWRFCPVRVSMRLSRFCRQHDRRHRNLPAEQEARQGCGGAV